MNAANLTVVIKSLGLGGAERLLVDALPYLDRSRFNYQFAYVTPWKDNLVPTIASEGFPLTCLGQTVAHREAFTPRTGSSTYSSARPLRALTLLPAALKRLQQLMAKSRCELLQADMPAAGILARIAGRRARVPVAYTEHNLQERYHPATRWANRATYAWNDVVFAVSEEVAVSIRRNGLNSQRPNRRDRVTDLRVLPNGVPVEIIQSRAARIDDLRTELNLPVNRPVVGTVAVFRPQKRLIDWVDVAYRVASAHPNALFLLVGDGPEMPEVRRRIKQYGDKFAQKVHVTGFREDGRRLMALIDVYLMTSEFEGLPIAMLEAMALAKPVVATQVGGIPEVIEHGCEGLLAPTGDVDLLAAHVRALVVNTAAASRMGTRGRDKVALSYHTRTRVHAMESAYRELLNRPVHAESHD